MFNAAFSSFSGQLLVHWGSWFLTFMAALATITYVCGGNFSVLQAIQQYRVGLALGNSVDWVRLVLQGNFSLKSAVRGLWNRHEGWGDNVNLIFKREIEGNYVSHERREESEVAVFWAQHEK
jgi:hypothetical protein